jgi:hypothetical protein
VLHAHIFGTKDMLVKLILVKFSVKYLNAGSDDLVHVPFKIPSRGK